MNRATVRTGSAKISGMLSLTPVTNPRSRIDAACAGFELANEDLVRPTRLMLARAMSDRESHARLINTLSMLEHLGSHKIMATQHSDIIDQGTLRHAAEEAHHAYFMKRQAEKEARRPLTYEQAEIYAASSGRMYFQRLEAGILARLRREEAAAATYLYMSMIVEFRALWFYRLYQQALRQADHGLSLKRILGEESHHLIEMAERLDAAGALTDARVRHFLGLERRRFERLLRALSVEIPAAATPPVH